MSKDTNAMSEFRVIATHCHDSKPNVYTMSHESFQTEAEAIAWMNGGSGENFSAACAIDTNGCDQQLIGYWLEEIEVWPQSEIGKWAMGVQVPIDDESHSNGEGESHTYVTHLQFSAHDDAHARAISARIVDLVTEWEARARWRTDSDEPRMLLAQGYAIEAENVTDADDWGEHIGAEDLCTQCWEPGGTNRLRIGSGSRVCATCVKAHRHGPYQIEDVAI